jgi:hypothetical protein
MTSARTRPTLTTNRLVWVITAVAVVAFWLVSTSFRPWDLFARAGFSSDFYDEQARVMLRGRLAVDPAVPGPEGFLIDGLTYLYYGPFLALLRLPFAMFGDVFAGRLVRISMLIALVLVCRWSARLATAARQTFRAGDVSGVGDPDEDGRWATALFTASVAFSPALFSAGWVTVYHETELWALALAIVTITLTVELAASGFSDRRLVVLASIGALATTLTRAPIGLGVSFAIGVCGIVLLIRRRSIAPVAGLAVIGGLLPIVSHAAINFVKFGVLLSVPGDKQLLSLQRPERAAFFESTGGSFFALDFVPTTLVQYLRPDAIRFERLVPFIRFGPPAENRGGLDVETITPASSIPSSALLLLVLALVGAVWIARKRSLIWGLVVAATSLGAVPSFLIGFIANRYLIDMLPPLIAAGAIGVWRVADLTRDRRMVRLGLAGLAVFGLWVNASLAIWTLELKSPGFTEVRYDIDRAIFGSDAPNVTTIAPGDSTGRDGSVGILDDCSGIYVAEQGRWVALERTPGLRVVAGEIEVAAEGSAEQVLASTDLWSLTYREGDGVRGSDVIFERKDGEAGFVREIPLALPISFEIIADPVVDSYFADVGGIQFFLPKDVLIAGGIEIDPVGTESVRESTPLCVEVAASDTFGVVSR